ncbi:hypothetical protein VU05_04080 [Desulfobulbus sp. F1]|nr:hypothetical protein [Desulfobulbus sp. F1]
MFDLPPQRIRTPDHISNLGAFFCGDGKFRKSFSALHKLSQQLDDFPLKSGMIQTDWTHQDLSSFIEFNFIRQIMQARISAHFLPVHACLLVSFLPLMAK